MGQVITIHGKNTYLIDGDVTYIILTQNQIGIIDTDDLPIVWPHRWYVVKRKYTYYIQSHILKPKSLYMHQLLFIPSKGQDTDHIHHNGLDNRRSEIRTCTRAENNQNTRPKATKGYKGVYYCPGIEKYKKKRKRCWVAKLTINRKRIYLGYFLTKKEAITAYDTGALKYFKSFACLNNIK